jgi:tetratricopeptide (TPR) repeat protein
MRFSLAVAIVLGVLLCSPPFDSAAELAPAQPSQVGKVNFPTGCSPAAQPAMENALALLHSFQYHEAEQAFEDAAKSDPQCALAYWGKAMARYEQLWDFPDAAKLRLGRRDIAQAQKLQVEDARVRGYVEAAAAFYQPINVKPVARVQAYSSAMEKLYREHPEDNEAAEFYALSLISLAQMGDDDLANRQKAIAILEPIFSQHPDNPGAAHYLIHACDIPSLASEGLDAARAYAKIAPDSPHALHMPSHIFRRLGLWEEVIDSNLASAVAAAKATQEHRGDADYQFHALDFLDYAYLQSGQVAKARELVGELKRIPGASESDIIDAQNRLAARNALELHQWKEATTLEIPDENLVFQDYTYWTRAIGAARSGDLPGARAAVQKLVEIAQAIKSAQMRRQPNGETAQSGMAIDPREAEAWLAYIDGKPARAIALLRAAAEREDAHDDEPFAAPAREMLADLLLALHRPGEALATYKEVLTNFPNRFNALYGTARAADAYGDSHTAANFYGQLISISADDADRPELQTAREYLAAHPAAAQ